MRSPSRLCALVISIQALLLMEAAAAKVIYVSKHGVGGDGGSWEHAVHRVGDAVDLSVSGDQIWIASGTYFESVTLKPMLSVYGGFIGDETDVIQRDPQFNRSTIDGSTANASVIVGASGAILDGLRIRGGRSEIGGGGLRCESASMVVTKCSIENNYTTSHGTAAYGGGVFCMSSELTLLDCVVAGNRAELIFDSVEHVPEIAAYGGGICAFQSSLRLERCTIHENLTNCGSANYYAQFSFSVGGGVYSEGDIELIACFLKGNRARGFFAGESIARGGAIASIGVASFVGCDCEDNLAQIEINTATTYVEGGGVFTAGQASFSNCRFFKNQLFGYSLSHQEHGGGVSLWCEGNANLDNCTVFTEWPENSGDIGPAEIRGISGIVSIRNSITGSLTRGSQIEFPNVMYSDILEGFPGEGNINLDPQFVDPANGDFRLLASSPCIDTGTTTGPLTDILGKTRPVDVPGVGRDGAGAFDMGAYEFQLSDLPTPTPTPTMTETPAITPTATATDTPTATPTPTRDPNASWIREWDLYR